MEKRMNVKHEALFQSTSIVKFDVIKGKGLHCAGRTCRGV